MSKNKKRKKKAPQEQSGGFKRFLRDLKEVLQIIGQHAEFSLAPLQVKKLMYRYNWRLKNPRVAGGPVSSADLSLITSLFKTFYRGVDYDLADMRLTAYQFQLLHCHATARMTEIERRPEDTKGDSLEAIKTYCDQLLDLFYPAYVRRCFALIAQLSKPDQRYYNVSFNFQTAPGNTAIELVSNISCVPASKCSIDTNGHKRPAFRLGKALPDVPFEWHSVEAAPFGNAYRGSKATLDVYIQSHALRRLQERLDLLNEPAHNFFLWLNTFEMKGFISYGRYFLLPFALYNIKVGYLVANVVDDILLFRTFLFITHNSTPEGDKLQQLTGLGKHDISYWRIDRLSTFVQLDEEKHADLINLFNSAGMGELIQLKEKEFNSETMQGSGQLDDLVHYVRLGQQETTFFEENWDINELRAG